MFFGLWERGGAVDPRCARRERARTARAGGRRAGRAGRHMPAELLGTERGARRSPRPPLRVRSRVSRGAVARSPPAAPRPCARVGRCLLGRRRGRRPLPMRGAPRRGRALPHPVRRGRRLVGDRDRLSGEATRLSGMARRAHARPRRAPPDLGRSSPVDSAPASSARAMRPARCPLGAPLHRAAPRSRQSMRDCPSPTRVLEGRFERLPRRSQSPMTISVEPSSAAADVRSPPLRRDPSSARARARPPDTSQVAVQRAQIREREGTRGSAGDRRRIVASQRARASGQRSSLASRTPRPEST